MDIKEIAKPVKEHLDEFDRYFKKMMKSKVPLLDLIVRYIAKKRGKRVRPTLVFLSAMIVGDVSERTYIAATMSELLHTATLVHDDVVDEAMERRGLKSINSAWTNKIAVLFGDYLLSRGLLIAIDNEEFDFLRALSVSIKRMSEGELLQMQKSEDMSYDEDIYFNIISDKTASLIANCCQIGAMSATEDKAVQQRLYEYGELIGLAFQIRDDIFDYVSKSYKIGKPVGNDLKEKKITLPLIYAFNHAEKSEAKEVLKLIKRGKLKKKDINLVLKFVTEHGGIDYSKKKAEELAQEAISKLDIFEDSEVKNSLINFAKFVINRDI